MKKRDSAAIELIQHVWDHSCRAFEHSWRRYNASLAQALSLAITSGMKFGQDDFSVIEKRYRPDYWMGLGSHSGESYYGTAVCFDNVSAAIAFERWKKRKPVFFIDIWSDHAEHWDGPRRLFVGASFRWNGEWVKVTRFNKDGESIGTCSYKEDEPEGYRREKVLHRYSITRAELQKAMKALRPRKSAEPVTAG